MTQDEARVVMGEPEMVETYPREAIWFYRTDLTGGLQASADADFTALIFNDQQAFDDAGRYSLAGMVPQSRYFLHLGAE